jgi:uncharacterized protein
MPYFITENAPECDAWAVVKEDGELMACHTTKESAIEQMVAISLSEGIEPGGTYTERKRNTYKHKSKKRELPEAYRPALSEDVPEGRACGNCIFYDESRVSAEGDLAWCERWDEFVRGDYYCDSWQGEQDDEEENREVNLKPPSYMRAAARRGLQLYEEGKGGDGLVRRTIDEARAMAAGNVTRDKWVRIAAWIARHLVDLDAPKNSDRTDPEYPGAGLVAHLLWGSGPSKRQAMRAMEYAKGVVDRLEAEDKRGNGMASKETRAIDADFEIREVGDGMTFVGYAAKFNSRSENLGGFVETITPGAFKRSLRSRNDVKLLVNHDSGRVLASTRSGTLRLSEDSVGLKVEADLPNTTDGRDMAELLRRGDLSSMSFGFSVIKDSWSSDGTERSLESVRLFETSIVAFPAYQATEASVRAYEALATRAEVDADDLADAILKLEEGEDLSQTQAELLKNVVEKLAPEATQPEDSVVESEPVSLELKRKQLELILKRV